MCQLREAAQTIGLLGVVICWRSTTPMTLVAWEESKVRPGGRCILGMSRPEYYAARDQTCKRCNVMHI